MQEEIAWSHPVNLYHMNWLKTDTPGLAMVPKLQYEHIQLTSYSKMRVDLVAQVTFCHTQHSQVLSNSVPTAM